jgi:hypothetical protein
MPLNLDPRHSTFDQDAQYSKRQASENARDTADALAAKLSAHTVTISRYTATGSTAAKIRLEASDKRPIAVMLAHAALVSNQSATLNAVGTPNFVWDATTRSLDVFEPAGLVQYEVYTLTFLVVEA